MFSYQNIGRICSSETYERGTELYMHRGVDDFQVYHTDKVDIVEAKVGGSSGNYYDVSMLIQPDTGKIDGYTCDCQAFLKYSGLCKHCVAVCLTYIEEEIYPRYGQSGSATASVITLSVKCRLVS